MDDFYKVIFYKNANTFYGQPIFKKIFFAIYNTRKQLEVKASKIYIIFKF